jgi:multicomponent K+:H+ antiporter subunit A
MIDENLLLLLILLPFLGSAVAAMLPANARNAEAWLSGTISVLAFAVAGFPIRSRRNGGAQKRRTAA